MTRLFRTGTLAAALSLALAATAAAETLRTGIDGTFAPHAMPTLDGKTEGFNIDLLEALKERLGVEIELDVAQFSGLLPGMQAGTYDFLIAPTTVSEERAENMLFTEGYLNTDFQFLVKAGTPEVESLEGFAGKTIAVNKGSVYDRWARDLEGEIGWTVESYGTNLDAIQAVTSGRAFANVAGNTNGAWAVKQNPQLELSYLHSTGRVFAMPLRLDSAELRVTLENAIECMKLDGTIAELHEKWFGYAPAPDSAAATVFPGTGVPGLEGYDPTPREPSC